MTSAPQAASGAATLVGTVTDANSKPIVGAEVSVRKPKSQRAFRKSNTNEGGRFSITKLELGQEYTLWIKVDGGRQEVGPQQMTSPETVRNISLPLGGSTVSVTQTNTTSTTTSDTATASASDTATASASETSSDTTSTATASASDTATASASETSSDTASTATASATDTSSATASDTSSATASDTSSATASDTATASASDTSTATVSASDTSTVSVSASASDTSTVSDTSSVTASDTSSATVSGTATASASDTSTATVSASDTSTVSVSASASDTSTVSVSASDTSTVSVTATVTEEPGFAALSATLHQADFAPEPPVNIDEAYELARLFTLSMFELANVPESINRLYTETRPHYQVGDLTIQGMDQPDPAIRAKMQSILDRRTQLFDTEQDFRAAMRSLLDLGTASVPSVNGDFKLLYREFVTLSSDDSNGVDPKDVRPQDPAQAAVILNFLRALKRAVLRVTQNLSVYGTRGTTPLVDKWSSIMNDSLAVLNYVATQKVVSSDADDRAAWSLLAALTDAPRSTVKAYVVNARDGGDLLKLAVQVYAAIQSGQLGANGLDNESDVFLENLFFTDGAVVPGQLGVALKGPATSIKENLAPLWP